MTMAEASLIFQRNGSMLVTPGAGLDRILRTVRLCAQLRSIVAGCYLYDLSPIALWGAAARGMAASDLLSDLARVSTTPVPGSFAATVADSIGRFGAVEIVECETGAALVARNREILNEIGVEPPAGEILRVDLNPRDVARVKLAAVRAGWPVIDRRQTSADAIPIALRDSVALRPYQASALASFQSGRDGVVLLPCGAGKTIVGVAAAARIGGPVLVLVPSRTVGEQWRAAFADATDCQPADVRWAAETGNGAKIVVSTYHAATSGIAAGELVGRQWRLVIYDEVQSLPANVFRLAAAIEADRRLGLSATLVREDGREAEVFALVGPPLYDASWLELERDGWIAPARCVEVRVPAASTDADTVRYRMAVVQRILTQHEHQPTIVVGTDVSSLRAIGRRLGFPVLTGASSAERRAELLESFRAGALATLGLSRIGSVGIDLPDASVLIQVSGTFGSRQEEAQRLGRVLRPAAGKTAHFYTIVAAGTREQHFAARRQRFLVNQGYSYEILDAASLPRTSATS
jgi:DNA excision repair protein ERCC-3